MSWLNLGLPAGGPALGVILLIIGIIILIFPRIINYLIGIALILSGITWIIAGGWLWGIISLIFGIVVMIILDFDRTGPDHCVRVCAGNTSPRRRAYVALWYHCPGKSWCT
jgi:hypothetical protein